MTTVSKTIQGKAFSKWLIGITLLVSLLSVVVPPAISAHVTAATPTEQRFFSQENTLGGIQYLQYSGSKALFVNLQQQKNFNDPDTAALRTFKTLCHLRFNRLSIAYNFYKSTLQFSSSVIFLLHNSETHSA